MTEFRDAKYITTVDGIKQIRVKINGQVGNCAVRLREFRHYAEMMEQVKEGDFNNCRCRLNMFKGKQ